MAQNIAKTKWRRRIGLLLGIYALASSSIAATPVRKEKVREEVAVMDTNLGRITFRFFSQESPKTVEAFKKLIRAGFFDGTIVHRVLPGLLIECGDPETREPAERVQDVVVQSLEIENNDLKHHPGTVSMAHPRNEPRSRSDFFICLQDVTYFDRKHTVIGEVISGLKVTEAISNVPRNLKQAPLFPVRIQRLYIEVQEFFKEVR